eukprot:TRINITY_DN5273_c0_g6_i1.p1 TRINITY_DN5273_c0_g6~~TRINITY_DN5273_c0_g6_i1.p1  ORF type:complete len:248 (+),score=70.96 TRINITY_DN5273_c0_g6_i1:59-802(+)
MSRSESAGEAAPIFDDDAANSDAAADWVADPEPSRGCCMKYGIMVINAVLLLAAVTLVTAGMMAKDWPVTKMCDPCIDLTTSAVVIGSIFLAISIVGVLATWFRHVGVLVTFVVTVSLLMLAMVGLTIASLVYAVTGVDLGPEWSQRVVHNDPLVCDLQHRYQCSGWTKCCAVGIVVPEECENNYVECLATCPTTSTMTASCKSSLQTYLQSVLIPFSVCITVEFLVILCAAFFSANLRNRVKRTVQ